jgi:hypothetical protein
LSLPGSTLPLEPLCQPCFVLGIFEIGSHELFAQGWLWTSIILISASWATFAHPPIPIFRVGSCVFCPGWPG